MYPSCGWSASAPQWLDLPRRRAVPVRLCAGYTAYTPSATWSAYAFYTYENLRSDQNGQSIRGGASRVLNAIDPARAWSARHRDRVDTAGTGLTWQIIENRLDVGVDVLYARSRSDVEVSTVSALTSAPLPTLNTRLESLGLHGGYRLRSDLMLNVRYWYERYRSTDWALDGVEANQLANVILLGETSPAYRVHVVVLSFTYRF